MVNTAMDAAKRTANSAGHLDVTIQIWQEEVTAKK
jgi:hypothetical protein